MSVKSFGHFGQRINTENSIFALGSVLSGNFVSLDQFWEKFRKPYLYYSDHYEILYVDSTLIELHVQKKWDQNTLPIFPNKSQKLLPESTLISFHYFHKYKPMWT